MAVARQLKTGVTCDCPLRQELSVSADLCGLAWLQVHGVFDCVIVERLGLSWGTEDTTYGMYFLQVFAEDCFLARADLRTSYRT